MAIKKNTNEMDYAVSESVQTKPVKCNKSCWHNFIIIPYVRITLISAPNGGQQVKPDRYAPSIAIS